MKRWLFNIAASVSLLLCMGMLGLWLASLWYTLQLENVVGPPTHGTVKVFTIQANHSGINVLFQRNLPPPRLGWSFNIAPVEDLGIPQWADGMRFYASVGNQGNPIDQIIVPCWAIALASALLPALWIYRFRRQRAIKPGLCPKCGYDLRATPDRCPECGAVASNPAASPVNLGKEEHDAQTNG